MISEKSKNAIDALSEQELRFEIERGRRSRFQRDSYAYLKVRFAELENGRQEATRQNSMTNDSKTNATEDRTMKIFLSWSGHQSHQVAVALRDWLPTVLPFTEPWVSSEDIDKGARWADKIAIELDKANFGVICIVPGNLDEPWLNFEAGAISKTLEISKVAPLLVGVEKDEVEGPLAQFQLTDFEKSDVRRLIRSINSSHAKPLADEKLRKSFDICWDYLEAAIHKIDFDVEDDDYEEDEDEEQDELEEKNVEILVLLAQNEGDHLSASEISHVIDENLTRTKHYLSLLVDGEYVYDTMGMEVGDVYGLDDNGRAYLVERDLV